jgi:hypothetical protein
MGHRACNALEAAMFANQLITSVSIVAIGASLANRAVIGTAVQDRRARFEQDV